jgi:hypothetical protein
MGLIADIMKTLRGDREADAPETVEGVEAALAKIAAERADAKATIASASDKRRQMLRADASDADVAAFDQSIDAQRLKLERLEIIEDDLLARLDAARSDRRRAAWQKHFIAYREAYPRYVEDARRAVQSLAALRVIVDQARASGFEHEAMAQMHPAPTFLLGPPEATAIIAAAEAEFARICEAADGRPKDAPKRLATPETAQLRSPRTQPPAAAPESTRKPPAAPRPRRSPRRETAGEGEVAVLIVRDGYEAPGGLQCLSGDIIALPADVAEAAVSRGAADFAKEG